MTIPEIIAFVETLTVKELVEFVKVLEVHFKLKEEKKDGEQPREDSKAA